MIAKQTCLSASLAVLFAASAGPARAEPDADASQPTGEVRPDDYTPSDPADDGEPANDNARTAPANDNGDSDTPGARDASPANDNAPPIPANDNAPPSDFDAGVHRSPPPRAHLSIRVPSSGDAGNVAPGSPPSAPSNAMAMRRRTGTFEIGAGYASDEGFLATARVAQSNLFGTGKGLSLSTLISARRQELLLRYDDPALFGSQLRLRADLYNNAKRYPGFTRNAAGGAISLMRTIAPHTDVFVGYKLEAVTATPGDTLALRGAAREPFWNGGTIAAVRAGIAYDDTNAPYLPTRGTRVGSSIEIADRSLGSDIDYTRTDAWISHHRALGPFTLHFGGTLRAISASAPLSERLHFDGSSDIRGYAPGAIGPRDDSGMSLGGNMMWTARGELEAPLVPSIGLSAVGFLDAGGLRGRFGGEDAASAGFGLIWRSPIGPLRFDWAYPLDGGGPRFVFGIGGMF